MGYPNISHQDQERAASVALPTVCHLCRCCGCFPLVKFLAKRGRSKGKLCSGGTWSKLTPGLPTHLMMHLQALREVAGKAPRGYNLADLAYPHMIHTLDGRDPAPGAT